MTNIEKRNRLQAELLPLLDTLPDERQDYVAGMVKAFSIIYKEQKQEKEPVAGYKQTG